jgi:hypothetical protein
MWFLAAVGELALTIVWDDAVHLQGRIEISQRALTVEGQLAVGSETDNQTKLQPGPRSGHFG